MPKFHEVKHYFILSGDDFTLKMLQNEQNKTVLRMTFLILGNNERTVDIEIDLITVLRSRELPLLKLQFEDNVEAWISGDEHNLRFAIHAHTSSNPDTPYTSACIELPRHVIGMVYGAAILR